MKKSVGSSGIGKRGSSRKKQNASSLDAEPPTSPDFSFAQQPVTAAISKRKSSAAPQQRAGATSNSSNDQQQHVALLTAKNHKLARELVSLFVS